MKEKKKVSCAHTSHLCWIEYGHMAKSVIQCKFFFSLGRGGKAGRLGGAHTLSQSTCSKTHMIWEKTGAAIIFFPTRSNTLKCHLNSNSKITLSSFPFLGKMK